MAEEAHQSPEDTQDEHAKYERPVTLDAGDAVEKTLGNMGPVLEGTGFQVGWSTY